MADKPKRDKPLMGGCNLDENPCDNWTTIDVSLEAKGGSHTYIRLLRAEWQELMAYLTEHETPDPNSKSFRALPDNCQTVIRDWFRTTHQEYQPGLVGQSRGMRPTKTKDRYHRIKAHTREPH